MAGGKLINPQSDFAVSEAGVSLAHHVLSRTEALPDPTRRFLLLQSDHEQPSTYPFDVKLLGLPSEHNLRLRGKSGLCQPLKPP